MFESFHTALAQPRRLVYPGSWVGHIPFVMWLVATQKPRVLVELGTHSGNSYNAICQSVAEHRTNTACYAVDTWAGDEHSGGYEEEVYTSLKAHQDTFYSAFSRLLRTTFDDASQYFADGTIDLLHIDGLHTYDAVKHDFDHWRAKLSSCAVVLFHDVGVREREFGVWKLWEELTQQFPGFVFPQSNGLGVLFVGSETPTALVALSENQSHRDLLTHLGLGIELQFQSLQQQALIENHAVRINQLTEGVGHHLNHIAQLEAIIKARDESMQTLQVNARSDIDALQAAAQTAAAAAQEQLHGLHALQNELSVEIAAQKSALAAANSASSVEQERIKQLQNQIGALNSHIDDIKQSSSWRVTAPLRKLGDLKKKFNRERIAKPAASTAVNPHAAATAPTDAEGAISRICDTPFVDKPLAIIATEPPSLLPVKTIAFYLPQFHPISENDRWWGKGFTEWTNVTRAKPRFAGHHQPHLPGELGFYDLRTPGVQHRQIELAKLYGVSGFCFYFYWFAGTRLLETPLLQYLNDSSLDLPFCLCWANENWSRRWDGLDSDILMAQHHSAEDDLAFIEYCAVYLRDPRYIRVGGKPLLLVYRPALLPDPVATTQRWRKWCRDNGVGEIHLAYTQSFEKEPPALWGFDSAIEFPPNGAHATVVNADIQTLDASFQGKVYDWSIFEKAAANYAMPDYPLWRSVSPSWDNTARKPDNGAVFVGSSPAKYREWLSAAALDTRNRFSQADEQLVFVNAWNEWAEGAHLEPDRRYGYAYLQAHRDALVAAANAQSGRAVVVVTHDAFPAGAQLLALNIARVCRERFKLQVHVVTLAGGELLPQFAQFATLHDLSGHAHDSEHARSLARSLFAQGARYAVGNTTLSGQFLATLNHAGFTTTALIHELGEVLRSRNLHAEASLIGKHANQVWFPAKEVRDSFADFTEVQPANAVIQPQGLLKQSAYRDADLAEPRKKLRAMHQLPADAKVILGVGYGDHRKGLDIFARAAIRLMQQDAAIHAIWVGHFERSMREELDALIAASGYADRFVLPGMVLASDLYFAGADVYALSSREDPFPSVVLHAMELGLPVVGFAGAGGFCDLLAEGVGALAPAGDEAAFAQYVVQFLNSPDKTAAAGKLGRRLIRERFSFHRYVADLLAVTPEFRERVSVVVPNYNYARYLAARLSSIEQQRHTIYELIVLDDASTDDSVAVITRLLQQSGIDTRFVGNTQNSGSVFKQWRKGVELARGDFVWIAEADDLSHPDFLTEVMPAFKDAATDLSYSESLQIDESGKVTHENYHAYVADVERTKWHNSHTNSGRDELAQALAIKNTIPNVSACVFRKTALITALNEAESELQNYRVAGDWLLYVHLLLRGNISFSARALNQHRRHSASVTLRKFDQSQLTEITRMQAYVAQNVTVQPEVAKRARVYAESLKQYLSA
jgi:O-antigen biosynthesis protein